MFFFFLQQHPLIAGMLVLGLLVLLTAMVLAAALHKNKVTTSTIPLTDITPNQHTHLAMNPASHASVSEQINALLPQTQCGQCGYAGCAPYAEAITAGEDINRCPPGGITTIVRLAQLLDRPVLALDTHAQQVQRAPAKAFIREAECIGCTKCIQACPVDAIIGAAKLMHTVIASECTGCDLCVEPCPVDCIDMITTASPTVHIAPAHTLSTIPLGVHV